MGSYSSIEWTEATWNPVTGCSKVSEGCTHCYAERLALRLQAMGNVRYHNGFKVTLHEDLLDAPHSWRSPRLIFVNSMSDLLHEDVPSEFIKRIFQTMNDCPQHTFQILTKRSTRLKALAQHLTWSANIWMGVSVENDRMYHRIHDLRAIPARVRFLSCEPLLGPTEKPSTTRHPLGDCRRRVRPGRKTDGGRMGAINQRPVPARGDSVFFQAMGWCPETSERP